MIDRGNRSSVEQRSFELAQLMHHQNHQRVDRMFVALMLIQWLAGIAVVLCVSPYTWIGARSLVHTHLWVAIIVGGLISSAPILLGIFYPGQIVTRHVIAIAQALWGALLIHLTGGRIETHFHVFGSLAFIAFYRDWKVLATMTIVVASDHAIRGLFFPLSVYGIILESPYRWIEHAVWVVFEDIVLVFACIRGLNEAKAVCDKQAELELTNQLVEQKVLDRSAELEDAKVFLESIFDSINAHICVVDDNGIIVETNEHWHQLSTNFANHDLGVGTNWVEICRQVETDRCGSDSSLARAIESVIANQEALQIAEYACHTPEKRNWYQVNVTPLKNHRWGAAVIALTDISRRVEAQQELVETSDNLELLSLVAKYTDNAVIITDSDGRIEWVNAGFNRTTGYQIDEVLGKKPGTLLQGKDTDAETVEFMKSRIQRQSGFDVEILNYHKSGNPYWVAIEVRPIHDELGNVVKYIAIESDISEKREREKERTTLSTQLQDAARQAGMAEVATGILHNVGNVLNSVNVSANLIKDRLNASPVQHLRNASKIIEENEYDLAGFLEHGRGKHLPSLIKELARCFEDELSAQLDEIHSLSKNIDHIKEIVSMQQSFAKQSGVTELTDPQDLFNDAIRIHQENLNRHNVQIVREFEPTPEIFTQRHEVIQILLNLIQNGQQAMVNLEDREKKLVLRIENHNEHVCFQVIDHGVGIPKDNLKRIFQHGFTTKLEGHGFGLHSCANTANALGGNLSVISRGVGCGAAFKLTLPLETKTGKPVSSNNGPPRSESIADDLET